MARWAVGRLVLSGHRQLVLLRPAGTLLLLHVLHYPQTIRAAARPSSGRCGRGPEMQLAAQLIDAASGPVDWSAYADQTAAELRALVEAKIQGQTPRPTETSGGLAFAGSAPAERRPAGTGRENQFAFQGGLAAETRPAVGMILPDLLPMLAVPASPFDSPEYVFEVKYDGVRALAAVEAKGVRLWGRERSAYTARYPELGGVAPPGGRY